MRWTYHNAGTDFNRSLDRNMFNIFKARDIDETEKGKKKETQNGNDPFTKIAKESGKRDRVKSKQWTERNLLMVDE